MKRFVQGHNARVFAKAVVRLNYTFGTSAHGHLMAEDDFQRGPGTLNVYADAMRASSAYDQADGAFTWRSEDGLVSLVNIGSFASGGLYDNGSGPGTTITQVMNADPLFTTVRLSEAPA